MHEVSWMLRELRENTNPLRSRMLASCTPAPHQGRAFQVTASRPRQKAKNGFVDIFMFDFRYLLELLAKRTSSDIR
jgi:hypothetical protein